MSSSSRTGAATWVANSVVDQWSISGRSVLAPDVPALGEAHAACIEPIEQGPPMHAFASVTIAEQHRVGLLAAAARRRLVRAAGEAAEPAVPIARRAGRWRI